MSEAIPQSPSRVRATAKWPGLTVLAVVLLVLPFLAGNDYHYDLMIKIALTAGVAVGLNLLVGYAGQISLGHAAFYAAGAYGETPAAAKG